MLWFYHRVMHPKDAAGMANILDPDQTAPCPDLSVRKLRIITVLKLGTQDYWFSVCISHGLSYNENMRDVVYNH